MAIGTEARAAGHAMEPPIATWRGICLGIGAVWLLIVPVYWPTVSAMILKWYESGTFAHGFLIPPIVVFFAWRRRHAFLRETPTPALWGGVLLAGAGLLWIIGEVASVLVVQQLALVAIVELVLLTVVGLRATWVLAFPLGFLWFAVPVGEILTGPLQDYTAWFTVHALRLSGVPVLVEGRALTTPTGHWLVAEACSGVRYVIPSIVLGVLFAWMTYQSWRRRVVFMLLSVAIPVIANGFRAYAIILLAHYTENRIAVGIDHLIYGWVFFGVVMVLLFVIAGRWRETSDASTAVSEAADDETFSDTPRASRRVPLALVFAAVLALSPPVLSATWLADSPSGVIALRAPAVLPPWTTTAGDGLAPRYLGATADLSQSYASGEHRVHLYVAQYVSERQGEELVNDVNRSIAAPEWRLIDVRPVQVRLGSETLTARQETLRGRYGQTRVAWTWFWVSGEHTLSPVGAKWLRVKSLLLGRSYNAAAIVVSTDDSPYRPAQPVLQDFLEHCPTLLDPLPDNAQAS